MIDSSFFIIFGLVIFFFGISLTICVLSLMKMLREKRNRKTAAKLKPVRIPVQDGTSTSGLRPFSNVATQTKALLEFEAPFVEALNSLLGCSHDSFPEVTEKSPWKEGVEAFPLYGTDTTIWYRNRNLSSGNNLADSHISVKFHKAKQFELPRWFLVELLDDFTFRYQVFFDEEWKTYLIDERFQSYVVVMDILREIHIRACQFYSPIR